MTNEYMSAGGNCEALAISGTSAPSRRYGGIVNITPTADCFVRQGELPTTTALATGVDQFLAANAIYTFAVKGYIAAITSGAAGTLYISPLG